MILGEAPGAEEDQSGVPFSGGAGRILDAWLGRAGITRGSCFIDNVVSHRPPGNNIALANLKAATSDLHARIRNVDPNLVLLLGNTPLQQFVAGTISDWRGSHFPIQVGDTVYQAFAAYHPAFIMRQRRMWDVTIHDFCRVKELSKSPGYKESDVLYITNPTIPEVKDFVHECIQHPLTVVDIETDFGFAAIDLVGLCYQERLAISVPVDEPEYVHWLFWFFKNTKGIGTHDSIFDAYHLRRFGFPCPSPIHNSLLYSHLLYPHLPHDLAFLASIYSPYSYYKDQITVRKAWYNCRDVDVTLMALHKQLIELRELNLI
jgi:uracil-DNA glycosylase family 4